MWLAYQRSFERLGNDPSIGRKLPSLLVAAGAAPVRNTYIFFGSCAGDPHFTDYVDNLIGVIRTARTRIVDEGLLDVSAFDKAIAAVREWSGDPAAAIWYAMSWAEGRRVE